MGFPNIISKVWITKHLDHDTVIVKVNFRRTVRGHLGAYRAIEELGELRNLKVNDRISDIYVDVVQFRTVNLGHKILQIIAFTMEIKVREGRKDDSCYGMQVCLTKVDSNQCKMKE